MQTGRWLGKILFCAALGLPTACAAAEHLVIDYMISSAAQRTAWAHIVNQFASENPDIKVTNNAYGQEEYKRGFTARLKKEKVDLVYWYAGERLRDAAKGKLLSPLDARQVKFLLENKFAPAMLDATRIDGEVYGVPLSYYAWGFAYRKSLFKRLGIRPPSTWSEFLKVCDQLKAGGVTPLAVGAKNGWPAAGWFDYLNLRINGIEFHRKLLRGEERFHDPRVREVFDVWGDLLREGYFLEATMDLDWDRVPPYLYRNQVGMMLMGAFVGSRFPPAIAADMGFFAFPRYSPDMPTYEDAPLDVLVLPANGANRASRKRFLAFLAESGALRRLNEFHQTVSPQGGNSAPPGSLRDASYTVVNGAAGLTFFYDRDATASLIGPTFDALRQFLKAPYDTDKVLRSIERSRRKPNAPGDKRH